MRLERGIRGCVLVPEEAGHKVLNSPSLPRLWEAMDTKDRPGLSAQAYLNSAPVPEMIRLAVRVKAIPASSLQTQAQIMKDHRSYRTTLFYQPVVRDETSQDRAHHAVQAVELIFAGHGEWRQGSKVTPFQGKTIEPYHLQFQSQNLIYRQKYKIQTQPLIRQTQTDAGELYLFHLTGWSQGRLNTVGILAYGGYYNPRRGIDCVGQTYAKLSTTGSSETKLIIRSLQEWETLGVVPHQKNIYRSRFHVFCEPFHPSDALSLAGRIQNGHVQFSLSDGDRTLVFRSVGYTQQEGAEGFLTLTFLPTRSL